MQFIIVTLAHLQFYNSKNVLQSLNNDNGEMPSLLLLEED